MTKNRVAGKIRSVPDEYATINGEPIDYDKVEAAFERLAADRAANLVPGGKSLTAPGVHSPAVNVRVSVPLYEALRERADAEQVSVSKLARRALEEFLRAS